jgi:5-formyltetrahydrofolate cyclo-ligase
MRTGEEKQEWRRRFREAVRGLDPGRRAEHAARMQEAVLAWEGWRRARVVLLYAALPGEPDTELLCRGAWASGKTAVFPRMEGEGLVLRRMGPGDAWETGRWGVREPGAGAEAAEVGGVDLALVPGAGFDRAGHRLGRGRGYYDRLLAAPGFRAVTVGCSFSCCQTEVLPAEPHDMGVAYLASERGILPAVPVAG